MSERKMKNTTLSVKTGISKNTISSISQNDGKMIQLETINKICQALEINPSMFFSYLPFDLEFIFEFNILDLAIHYNNNDALSHLSINEIDIDLIIKSTSSSNLEDKLFNFNLKSKIPYEIENFPFASFDNISVFFQADDEENRRNFQVTWEKIPIPFQTDLADLILESFCNALNFEIDKKLAILTEYTPDEKLTEILNCISLFSKSLDKIITIQLDNFIIPNI